MFGKGMEWTFCPSLRMEYLPCGDLCSVGVVDEVSAREIIKQVLEALQFMHAHRIAHQDVKPEVSRPLSHTRERACEGLTDPLQNIMIKQRPARTDGPARSGDGWWIKLVDMGVATYYPEQDDHLPVAGPYGTVPFLSPDILRLSLERPVPSAFEQVQKADVWAVGITMFVTATRGILFWEDPGNRKELGLYNKYLAPTADQPLPNENMSPEARRFLRFLVEPNIATRPTAQQALAHEWLLPDRGGPSPPLRTLLTAYLEDQKVLQILFSDDETYLIVVGTHKITVIPIANRSPEVIYHSAGSILAVAPLIVGILTIYESTNTITRIHVLSRTVIGTFKVRPPVTNPPNPTYHLTTCPSFSRLALTRNSQLTLIDTTKPSPFVRGNLNTTMSSPILGVQFLASPDSAGSSSPRTTLAVATSSALHYLPLSTTPEGRTILTNNSHPVPYPYPGPPHSISIPSDGDGIALCTASGETWTTRAAWGCWRRGEQVAAGSEVFVSSEAGTMAIVNGGKVAVVKGVAGDGRVMVFWEEEAAPGAGGVKVAAGERVRGRVGGRWVATGFGVVRENGGRMVGVRVREGGGGVWW